MKLIVGLGNPGPRYHLTRHNVGFDVITAFADRFLFEPARVRFDGLLTDHLVGSDKVVLLAPQTFMNASGRSVRQCVDFFRVDPADVMVVLDDLNLDVAKLRLRPDGSAGGQKGLADIIRHLGTDQFPRLRIGIGRPPGRMDASDYVLHKFSPDERSLVDVAVQEAVAGLERWIRDGLSAAMNLVNQPTSGSRSADEQKQKKRQPTAPDGSRNERKLPTTPSGDAAADSGSGPT